MPYLTVTPAYGRDYRNQREAIADWEAGLDFRVADAFRSGYVSVREVEPGTTVNIRYRNLTRIAVVKPK